MVGAIGRQLSAISQRIANAVGKTGGDAGPTPPRGRITTYVPRLDQRLRDLTEGVTFASLRSLIKSGQWGDLARVAQVFSEFEERDTHLGSVARTRRLALTGLDWEIVSAADVQQDISDRRLADDAAAYARDHLSEIESFDEALEHLATAIGPNVAALELLWGETDLIGFVPVPPARLAMRPDRSPAIHVRTEDDIEGVPATGDKWAIHIPQAATGVPTTKSLARTCATIWLIKMLAVADWATYCEKYGMPVRTGKYKSGATAEEKAELADMLANMGANAWAMFSEAIDVEVKESSQRGTQPYEALLGYCDRQLSIAWLGGHLTVDTAGATGTYAAGAVQNEVRQDLRDDDIRRESRTVRRQILKPMMRYAFPGLDVPVPHFRRVVPDVVDRLREADLLTKATQGIGLPVELSHAYERLGIPAPEIDEATGLPVHPVVKRIAVNPFEGE